MHFATKIRHLQEKDAIVQSETSCGDKHRPPIDHHPQKEKAIRIRGRTSWGRPRDHSEKSHSVAKSSRESFEKKIVFDAMKGMPSNETSKDGRNENLYIKHLRANNALVPNEQNPFVERQRLEDKRAARLRNSIRKESRLLDKIMNSLEGDSRPSIDGKMKLAAFKSATLSHLPAFSAKKLDVALHGELGIVNAGIVDLTRLFGKKSDITNWKIYTCKGSSINSRRKKIIARTAYILKRRASRTWSHYFPNDEL